VFTTHKHIDHIADLTPVQNMVDEYNGSLARRSGGTRPHPTRVRHYWDCGTHQDPKLHIGRAKGGGGPRQLRVGIPVAMPPEARLAVSLERTYHIPEKEGGCVALRYDLLGDDGERCFGIGISSDAAPSSAKKLSELFKGCGLVVLHLSKTDEHELAVPSSRRPGSLHLGTEGCAEIISAAEAELYLVSEFSAERGDYRYQLVGYLVAKTGTPARVLPADIGLVVKLPRKPEEKLGVRCSQCGRFAPAQEVRALRPHRAFGRIQYVCSSCLL
jgi:hypothetical protein